MSNAAASHTIRIQGVILPPNAHILVGLRSIFGVGASRAKTVCTQAGIAFDKKVKTLTDDELRQLQNALSVYELEGDLRRELAMRIKRLRDIRCFRGVRHSRRLPCRGQRTRTNAQTVRKGRGKGGAGGAGASGSKK